MKATNNIISLLTILLLLLFAPSCSNQDQTAVEEQSLSPQAEEQQAELAEPGNAEAVSDPLPVVYQQPAYMVDEMPQEDLGISETDSGLKVGATIKSTRGPQPLWDILKRLAALKKMNVSWASDVDQNVLVDVDINANDDFYQAIDNLLRQVDYFHVMQGNTIVVKYKETKQFRIAMPFVRSNYKTGVGGDMLGNEELKSSIEGTIALTAEENTFDVWENIKENMDKIIALWSTTAITPDTPNANGEDAAQDSPAPPAEGGGPLATRQISSGGVTYLIDKPVGIITVTAPRPLLNELQNYFDNLTSELYKQVSIEAKIIEVKLKDNSSIGINWNEVFENFNVIGTVTFGDPERGGQIWPYVFSDNRSFDDGVEHGNLHDPTRFISKLSLDATEFNFFVNALESQGDTEVLSNPKLSLLNGQPSLLSVGKNVTYIDRIEAKTDPNTGGVTYTIDTARVLSGLGIAMTATILNNKEVVLNLVPVTSELVEPIVYRTIGLEGTEIGLPVINVREMSTTVRVKDNEMLVIGGLIDNVKETEGNFMPLIGRIPIIRYLFGYEKKTNEKRELIILLRPRII